MKPGVGVRKEEALCAAKYRQGHVDVVEWKSQGAESELRPKRGFPNDARPPSLVTLVDTTRRCVFPAGAGQGCIVILGVSMDGRGEVAGRPPPSRYGTACKSKPDCPLQVHVIRQRHTGQYFDLGVVSNRPAGKILSLSISLPGGSITARGSEKAAGPA